MENNSTNSTPYTVKLPALNKRSLKNAPVAMPLDIGEKQIRNPFIIPGLKKVNVDSNLNPAYSFDNFVSSINLGPPTLIKLFSYPTEKPMVSVCA